MFLTVLPSNESVGSSSEKYYLYLNLHIFKEANGDCLDGMTCVSLLLVELVSPDVMYNGLPWPDEDFTKVYIVTLIISR